MRAKCGLEKITGGRQAIIVTEIPYQVNKSNLIKRIAELVNDKVIDDISDVRDESDRDGMRIVIELKRGASTRSSSTSSTSTPRCRRASRMIFLAVHNGQPKELPLPEAIRAFIDHRIDVVRRRTAFLLRKAREREHILLGYQIALDHLDNVIKIIRQSSSRADARENLFQFFSNRTITLRGTELNGVKLDPSKYAIDLAGGSVSAQLADNTAGTLILSYRQIDAILELQLYRLTQLSIDELLNELRAVRDNIAEYESILASEKKLRAVIIKELEDIRDNYGDARRTAILDESAELTLEDLIADEQVAVTVSHSGYLKRTPISTYRQQRRGGTGRLGMKTREEDFVSQLIIDSTHAYLLCFTNTGRVYWLKVYEIPDVGAAGKGKSMASLVDLQPGEKVVTILPVRDLEEDAKYVLFATRNGTVKKTPLKDFSNVMARGIIAIGIDKDDELVAARITDGKQIIFLATHDGMAIRFDEQRRPLHGPSRLRRPRHHAQEGRLRHRRRRHALQRSPQQGPPRPRRRRRPHRPGRRGPSTKPPTPPPLQPLALAEADDTAAAPELVPEAAAKLAEARREARPHPLPHPHRHRERLRQAHRRRRLPPAVPRRQGRHQHEDHAQDRQSRQHPARRRHHGDDGHQPVRQDHPHRHQDRPRRRPLHHGRQAPRPRRPTTRSPAPPSSHPKTQKPTAKTARCCSKRLVKGTLQPL